MLPDSKRSDVDEVIDRVAADATAGEPGAEFRAKVLARLEARRPRYSTWMLTTAAAIVLIAAFITVLWPHRTALVQEQAAVVSPGAESGATLPVPIEIAAAGSLPVVHAELASFALPAITLPPLEAIEPITMESIQPTKLSIPQLTVEPIVMPALDNDGSIRERR